MQSSVHSRRKFGLLILLGFKLNISAQEKKNFTIFKSSVKISIPFMTKMWMMLSTEVKQRDVWGMEIVMDPLCRSTIQSSREHCAMWIQHIPVKYVPKGKDWEEYKTDDQNPENNLPRSQITGENAYARETWRNEYNLLCTSNNELSIKNMTRRANRSFPSDQF